MILISSKFRKNFRWLCWLILFSFALRFLSFNVSVIDHDESSYLIISKALLHGSRLYTDVWDTKPPGIFLLFSALQFLFGQSVVVVRIAAAIAVALTGFMIYQITLRRMNQRRAAVFAGFLYVYCASVFRWGLPANTEIFFNLFTSLALLFYIHKPIKKSRLFFSGLLLGMGFVLKPVVAFDALAFGLPLLFFSGKYEWNSAEIKNKLLNGISLLAGFLFPFVCVHIWFYFSGNINEYLNVTYVVAGRYPTVFKPVKMLLFFIHFHLNFFPVVLLFYAGIILLFRTGRSRMGWFAVIWWSLIWIAVLLPGKTTWHYLLQLLVPLCVFAPEFLFSELYTAYWLRRKLTIPAVILLLVSFIVIWFVQKRDFINKPDTPREIATWLKPILKPNDVLYVDYKNIVYYLCDKKPPLKYVHPTLITYPEHLQALGINKSEQFQKIVNSQPNYLVMEGSGQAYIQRYIKQHCIPIATFEGKIKVYMKIR